MKLLRFKRPVRVCHSRLSTRRLYVNGETNETRVCDLPRRGESVDARLRLPETQCLCEGGCEPLDLLRRHTAYAPRQRGIIIRRLVCIVSSVACDGFICHTRWCSVIFGWLV